MAMQSSPTMPAEPAVQPPAGCPVSDYDIYQEEHLFDPHPGYAELRAMGGVVWMSHHGFFALPRYETTKAALNDWKKFSSAEGVLLNDMMNGFMQGTLLCSDPPVHDVKRKVIMEPLNPAALRKLRDDIESEANAVVADLCARGTFNAATELAEHLPLSIVANRVGLPPVQRDEMLTWAKASFDCIGPIENERTQRSLSVLPGMSDFIRDNSAREKIAPGSWLDGLYRAADAGLIPHEACGPMSIDYIGPSLDTTISALGSAILLFARHPEQWALLREKPGLAANAVNEIVRLESPIQGWSRYVTEDYEFDGVVLPRGSRVLVMFASANRDDRKWVDPERFDITRQAADHVGFGAGEHACAGANLARMEIMAVLSALLPRVERIELIGEPVREVTQVTRGWSEIPVRVHLKG